MDVAALKEQFSGFVFDEIELDVKADSLRDFALACGETLPRFVDPDDGDFQSVPNYTTQFHGSRALPPKFPVDMNRCFDAGKSVLHYRSVRPGERIVGRSEIHDIFEKSGRSGSMLFIVHRMNFYNQDGDHLSQVDWRLVQREMD